LTVAVVGYQWVTVAESENAGGGWLRVALACALPALIIGVFLYPDIQVRTMPAAVAMLILLAVAVVCVVTGRPRLVVIVPVVASVLPSQLAGFTAYLIVLFILGSTIGGRRLVCPLDSVDWALLAVLVWITASWIINMGMETDPWSLPVFLVTFLSPWLVLCLARAATWTSMELERLPVLLLGLAAAQLAPALLKPVLLGARGAYAVPLEPLSFIKGGLIAGLIGDASSDQTFGTTPSAHHLGVLLLLAIVLLMARSIARRQAESWPVLLAMSFVFLMTDAKHVILAAVPSALLFGRIVVWPLLSRPARRAVVVIGVAVIAVAGGWIGATVSRLVVQGLWKPYLSLATFNPKVQLVIRTVDRLERNDLNTWMGLGPGSYATRAATIRATDVLFKAADRLPSIIPPHTGASYRAAAYDLYTSDVALTAKFRSGVLTNPFSSVVGVVAEFGLLGTALLGWLLLAVARRGWQAWRRQDLSPTLRAAGATLGFAVPLLATLGLFDSYFEQPDVTAPIILLGVVVFGALEGGRATNVIRGAVAWDIAS